MNQTKKSIVVCAALSMIFHLALAAAVIRPTAQAAREAKKSSQRPSMSVDLLDPVVTKIQARALTSSGGARQLALAAESNMCPDGSPNFIGIGMTVNPGSNRVISAPRGYPAHSAGIRVGDHVDDPYVEPDGAGIMHVTVTSSTRGHHALHIPTEKICYRNPITMAAN